MTNHPNRSKTVELVCKSIEQALKDCVGQYERQEGIKQAAMVLADSFGYAYRSFDKVHFMARCGFKHEARAMQA